MNKAELIASCAEKTHINMIDVEKYINAFMETIEESLAAGGEVKLLGFGKFEVRETKGRVGRNPRKPQEIYSVPPKKAVKFTAGMRLKDAVNKEK